MELRRAMCLALGIKRQLIAAVVCALATLVGGMINGWPAPTLKKLRQPGSPIHLTTEQETWLVTALHIGTLLSPFPAGFMMNKLGRKASLLALGVLPVISFGLIYVSTTPEMLILARLLAGLWIGGSHTVVPIYIAEISEPEVRGILSALNQVLSFLGNILIYAVGPYMSIRSTAVFCGAVAVIFLVLFASCPESPYFHIMRGHPERAVSSLIWLRGGPPTPSELGAIRGYLAARGGHGWRRITDLLTAPENRKAFVIVEVLSGLDRLSGISCMKAFSSVVLPAHLGPLTSDHCTLIVSMVWMASSMVCTALIDKTGRKPLLYISSFGVAVSMFWTGMWYFLSRQTHIDVSSFSWLPLAGFLVYGCAFSVGWAPITHTFQGELFPSHLKEQASAMTTIVTALTASFSTFMFGMVTKRVGVYANFLWFSVVGVVNLIFVYVYVIETKGRTLEEIQAELKGKKREVPVVGASIDSIS